MPSLFVGHGSPMNLIEGNQFSESMLKLGQRFKPKAIVVISAHWLESNSVIQNANQQKQIYDFYGFPDQLYKIVYTVPGWDQSLVERIHSLQLTDIQFTDRRGIDHGVWAVLYRMYPQANIPVVQLSIPHGREFSEYFTIGKKLAELRKHGVMIIGSGNIIHNLHRIKWDMNAAPANWAIEFDQNVKSLIDARQFDKLISLATDEKELFHLAHPTSEHFIPLLYTLGAASDSDELFYPCEFIQNESISMRSVLFTND